MEVVKCCIYACLFISRPYPEITFHSDDRKHVRRTSFTNGGKFEGCDKKGEIERMILNLSFSSMFYKMYNDEIVVWLAKFSITLMSWSIWNNFPVCWPISMRLIKQQSQVSVSPLVWPGLVVHCTITLLYTMPGMEQSRSKFCCTIKHNFY